MPALKDILSATIVIILTKKKKKLSLSELLSRMTRIQIYSGLNIHEYNAYPYLNNNKVWRHELFLNSKVKN